jgi:hypothetical protein
MRFDDDDLRLANSVTMLFTRKEVEKMAVKKKIKIGDEWVVKLAELNGFMAKEEQKEVDHPTKKTSFCK